VDLRASDYQKPLPEYGGVMCRYRFVQKM
jgi:hypothetical protein